MIKWLRGVEIKEGQLMKMLEMKRLNEIGK